MEEKLHIIPHQHQVKRADRNQHKKHNSCVLWFTGLSGSGKSTIASHLEKRLLEKGIHTYLLDGDNVRSGLNQNLGFSAADREENLRRIGEVAKLFVDAGILTLAAFISPLQNNRDQLREIIGEEDFVEIYVNTPLEECERRDVKGLYKKARKGEISNFTGISAPYEAPQNPDLEILTLNKSVEEATQEILDYLFQKKINLL